MSLWGIIVPEYLHWSDNGHAWGVSRDEDYTLLLMNIGIVGVALAHNDVDLRPRIPSSADPPVTHGQYPINTSPRREGNLRL